MTHPMLRTLEEKILINYIADMTKVYGHCHSSNSIISRDIFLPERFVEPLLRMLEELGFIEVLTNHVGSRTLKLLPLQTESVNKANYFDLPGNNIDIFDTSK
jgi:hypothetical protein